ncbi:hypothetical protein NJLHNGOC_07390 [Novacetimonas cocois]|uniref:Uncharacterized protein n=1 Tax=Novacetimonas cocois TaxID=1747507 RepID=A0A365YWM3_9PROT|nr:hypothetical protein NJLHNGOC_07390 [Novacetimonas cocois]
MMFIRQAHVFPIPWSGMKIMNIFHPEYGTKISDCDRMLVSGVYDFFVPGDRSALPVHVSCMCQMARFLQAARYCRLMPRTQVR